jgi:predicted dehydrogenase
VHKEARLLRIGVLGCGPIAQIGHFEAIRKARNAELYAICDAAPDLVDRMRVIHEPRVAYSSYGAMLADPWVEAIVVAVADQFHVPLAQQAVAAGKHVFVEKPMGVAVEEAEDLREQVRGSRVVFQIGHNLRFDPGITYARQFISEELGELMALKAWYCDSTYRYTMTDNVQSIVVESEAPRRPAGNPKSDRRRYYMLGHGSHLVDQARFLGGEIRSVHARLVEKFGAYCWFASADFANGAVGHLDLTIAVRGDFEGGFRIYAEHGSINGRTYLPWFHKSSEVECFSMKDGRYHRPLGEDGYTYRRQIEGFADTILHGIPQHGATIDDGVASVRAMVALARSAETGDAVRLDEVTGAV